MAIYDLFAEFYAKGDYHQFSRYIFEALPLLQEHYHLPETGSLLDLACGTGVFANTMAASGWQTSALDQSLRMLEIARRSATNQGVKVHWIQADLRSFDLPPQFDLATCWFDSLNYLLSSVDLAQAFANTHQALKPGGFFVFDMNTIYSLAVDWQQKEVYVQQDSGDLMEIHRPSFDHENQTATLHITGFIKKSDHWQRFDEIHRERGYPILEIRKCLESAGFSVIDYFSSLRDFSKPKPESKRVWFIAQRV